MRRRFALVFNARAGLGLPRLLDGVLTRLRAAGAEVFQLAARTAGEATDRVREAVARGDCDALIAAGGDGTFRAVATGAAGSDTPVGIIPIGTGNVLSHEIGLKRRADAVARTLLQGCEVTARGGTAQGAPFFLMAGAGFDAQIVSGLNYNMKRVLGRAAYSRPVLRTLSAPPQMFDVEVDGRAFQASWVILTLVSHYGGSFELTPLTWLGANRLIAVVISARSRTELAQAAVWLARRRLTSDGRPNFVSVLAAEEAMIGRRVTVPVQIDGDEAGTSPLHVRASGPQVRVIVPPAYVAALTNRQTNQVDFEL